MIFVTYQYFAAEDRQQRLAELEDSTPIGDALQSLQQRWEFTVGRRAEGVPLASALVNFTEELRAGDRAWFGFHSMFSYAPEERLPSVTQPSLVINVEGALKDPTRAAADLLENHEYREFTHMRTGIFELHVSELAGAVEAFIR